MTAASADDAVDELFSAFNPRNDNVALTAVEPPQKKRLKTDISSDADTVDEPWLTTPDNQTTNTSETAAAAADTSEEVVVETYEGDHNCLHECVRPKGYTSLNYETRNKEPACSFPYTLDPFQATAIQCLEIGESVLVSAHTSAGKTTVAEYAVAMGLRDKQRVIYTSPIKALSNQKFRDLSGVYGDNVGLLTGDVSLNPSASVVIMTTEILRSMLYRGSEMIREIKWVIFDEIHYMRDRDRGVVWEETIILLPDTIRLVFLSATIPNAREFAEWICRIKHQPCHVIYTDYRPVPLQHYLFPVGGDSVHLVLDEKKNFKEANFHKAVAELNKSFDSLQTETKAKLSKSNKSDIEKIVLMCHERNYTPVIIFAFSKREVEANALNLKRAQLTTPEEAELIEKIFNSAMDTLGEDRSLPQISHMLPLLKRGIGLHHGGLLPIIKEIVEILFQESLLKVLFSTETFSMGVNMPAKTVVFTKLKKWDGAAFRLISAGEYIQMSGRAGRRGLDERGLTIIMFDEQMEPETAKRLFLGEPLRIESQFHLGYNMLLNLLRVEGANPEYMIQRSFYQFQQDKMTLELEGRQQTIKKRLAELTDIAKYIPSSVSKLLPKGIDVNKAIAEYYSSQHESDVLLQELKGIIMQPKYVLKYLQPGRVITVENLDGIPWGYGIVEAAPQKQRPIIKRSIAGEAIKGDPQFTVNVILKCQPQEKPIMIKRPPKPCIPENENEGVWESVTCSLSMIKELTQVVANIPSNLESHESKDALGHILMLILKELKGNLPSVDPIEDMKIDDPRVSEIVKKLSHLEKPLRNNLLTDFPALEQLYQLFHEKVTLNTERQELQQKLDAQRHLVMRDDLRAMRRVLRKLEYLDEQNVVTVKGQAACEVSSVDELVVCELLFHNTFERLPNEYLVAMLSCLVFEEKADNVPPTDPKLFLAYEAVREAAQKVGEVSAESKLPVNVTDYVEKFKPVLMDITFKWMNGCKFADLGLPEDIFEGSVVRALRRLEELLRQLACAGKSIGHEALEARFSEAILKMRRGIVFSASLYL